MSELGSGNGTSYPGTLDTDNVLEVDSPSASKTKARADVPNDANAAIIAIETELGTDPAGSLTDVKTFLQTEHDADGTHNIPSGSLSAGQTVQVVNTQTGAVNTGTTVIPFDDTIPQNTEGDEYMTLAVTPTSATNELIIESIVHLSHSAAGSTALTCALFQDTTANALAAAWQAKLNVANGINQIVLRHKMVSGTTSSTTFKIRAGSVDAGTTTFNGQSGSRLYGGVLASSITITEIKV
jgi:hypothetical protein